MAHNTNVTHPIISLQAIRLIEGGDGAIGSYRDLYRREVGPRPEYGEIKIYWGTWNKDAWGKRDPRIYLSFDAAKSDAYNGYSTLFGANPNNVIHGVVREDVPDAKVRSHFYHAYTADPLIGFVTQNSRERALPWFVRAVNEFDYESQWDFRPKDWFTLSAKPSDDEPFAKELAFQSYGESLHHVEDMSSMAHVHDDAHLTLESLEERLGFTLEDVGIEENDDYEAMFLPRKIFEFHDTQNPAVRLQNWFLARTHAPAPVNKVEHIWPAPLANANEPAWGGAGELPSLARQAYNASIFQGDLKPLGFWEAIAMFGSPKTATGELAQMFQFDAAAEGDRYLRYDARHFWQFPVWHIENVGDFHFLLPGFFAWKDDWWPTEKYGGPKGYFYLEQKLQGKWESDRFAVAPGGMRRELLAPYDPNNNPLDPSKSKVLLDRFAETLVPLAVQYAAGFSQWWFDIANPPPYLKWVKVKQNAISVQRPDGNSDEYEFTGYDAHWQNGHAVLEDDRTWDDSRLLKGTFVAERKLKRERPTQPLYRDRELQVLLQFNESMTSFVKDGKYDPASEFKLGLQLESSKGTGSAADVMLPVEDATKVTIKSIDSMGPDDGDSACGKPHLKDSCWKVTVTGDVLKDIDDLEGAVRLIVYAKDANKHMPDTDHAGDDRRGPYLDGKPQTPAKRKATWEGGNLKYNWYDGSMGLTSEYADSALADGTRLAAKHFNYEYEDGDRSHILWFSHKTDPAAEKAATINQGFDLITITTMPKTDDENAPPASSNPAPAP